MRNAGKRRSRGGGLAVREQKPPRGALALSVALDLLPVVLARLSRENVSLSVRVYARKLYRALYGRNPRRMKNGK